MTMPFAAVMLVGLLASSVASSQSPQAITVTRSGSQASRQGPAETFTGSVRIDPLFNATPPSRTSVGRVTFEPGARTAWHTHPLGQTLIVTAGAGWVRHGVVQFRKCGKAMWSGSRRTRNTGTAPR
jgi:4-carboxymuconolactone decarboxylase